MSNEDQHNVRTFTAPTLREALAQIRNELGPDALIMGQRQLGHRIAVDACLELPPQRGPEPIAAEQGSPQAARTLLDDERLDAISVRDAHDSGVSGDALIVGESAAAVSQADELTRSFVEAGYDPDLLQDISGCHDLVELRRTVTHRLSYAHKPLSGLRGCYRFVGAAGVGKSTTLIKVLVEWVLRNSAGDVVVVSTDNERLAGTEALQLTCQMLSVPMRECATDALPAVLKQLSSKALVLVDSPALERRRPLTPVPGLQDIWVLSVMHGVANLRTEHRLTQGLRPVGVVATQVDQLAAPDEIANLLYQWRIPVYWLGTGSSLPDSIELADADTTYKHLFAVDQPVRLEIAV